MHFELSEEQLMIKKAARDFAQNELKPGVIERDEHQKFPAEQVKMLGELGFLGMMVDPKYNGSGLDSLSPLWLDCTPSKTCGTSSEISRC
ncbi:MAG: acyl-CoA dehydrogenase family protein, partial [Pedobacter sp.]